MYIHIFTHLIYNIVLCWIYFIRVTPLLSRITKMTYKYNVALTFIEFVVISREKERRKREGRAQLWYTALVLPRRPKKIRYEYANFALRVTWTIFRRARRKRVYHALRFTETRHLGPRGVSQDTALSITNVLYAKYTLHKCTLYKYNELVRMRIARW